MEPKTIEWRPGPAVCRCCLAEGCYKDISTEYFWMGKREVYAEMLSETLDLSIAYSTSGGPNSNSRLICEQCISKLRDATEFKRQVQECERTFIQWLDPGNSVADATATEVKLEQVKKEKNHNSDEDDDFNDQPDFGDDDGYDDLDDDVPLTKYASKTPKKEPVDLQDLLDNVKPTTKRKSTTTKDKSTAKKAKVSKEKATSSKPKPEKKKKETNPARSNAEIIILNTTAYPFRVNDKSMLCVFCLDLYDDAEKFRLHMQEEHFEFYLGAVFKGLPKLEFIKADISDMKCRICWEKFSNLETVAEHLKTTHELNLDLGGKLGIMPYMLRNNTFDCALCEKKMPTLSHLNRHTITHFLSYVCHVCGSSYAATTGLLKHVRSKHQQYEATCKRCKKTFPSIDAKEKHRRTEKACMSYGCTKCSERFYDWRLRKTHMELAHGQSRRVDRCNECDINFTSGSAYYSHFKLKHSAECVVCKYCGSKFASRSRLKRHLTKHTF
ncbi:zinc finger protein 26-like isoform X13 [Aricia agestis]|uniref:zinc finger protein 26-like isoform X13 n=1 Tax=Aricia agestis TaxID=91739 RepID=UPI001C202360|nr:zinc finger protein 26-like isoform X13 [Aricia agestis]